MKPTIEKAPRRARPLLGLLLLACALHAGGCTTMVARRHLPYPLTTDRFADPVKVVTIPLPAIAASPNEGVTYGGLTAFLLHDRNDEVDSLVAPQLYYNPNFGVTGALYGTFALSPDRDLEFNASRSTKVNDDLELTVRDKTLLEKRLELRAFLYALTDGSARFYGFHADSPQSAESNFGDREIGFTLSAGYDVGDHFQVVFGERLRNVNVVKGAVVSLPFTADVFPVAAVPGLDGSTTHAQKLTVVYDTTDSKTVPTRGVRAAGSVEGSFEALGSSADFVRYDVEVKGYLPLWEERFITAGRLASSVVRGTRVPFLETSILGGENSLRGFGRNRFFDRDAILLNLEERIQVIRGRLFNVMTSWELAPFLDVGAVAESLARLKGRTLEFNPGVGFRAAVKPNIVGRIDVGYGKEGVAVYVGLKYPF